MPQKGSKSSNRCPNIDALTEKGGKRLSDGWKVSFRSTDELDCLIAVKMLWQQISLPTDTNPSPQAQSPTDKRKRWLTETEHSSRVDREFKKHQFLTLYKLTLGLEYVSSALKWQQRNSSQPTLVGSRVRQSWSSCLRSNAYMNWLSNQILSLLGTRITFVGIHDVQPGGAHAPWNLGR